MKKIATARSPGAANSVIVTWRWIAIGLRDWPPMGCGLAWELAVVCYGAVRWSPQFLN